MTRCTPLAAALVVAAGAQPAAAQKKDDPPGDRPQRCISLLNLDRTDVVDNRTILFHMRNGRIYLNHLSRDCPGLEREKRFMYSPTSTQLCEVDGVTVIEKWGFGFTRGFTCSLGEFHPLSKSEFESLMETTHTTSPSESNEQRSTVAEGGAGSGSGAGSVDAGRADAGGRAGAGGKAAIGGRATIGGPANTLRPTDEGVLQNRGRAAPHSGR
jgi:hypothetical protein